MNHPFKLSSTDLNSPIDRVEIKGVFLNCLHPIRTSCLSYLWFEISIYSPFPNRARYNRKSHTMMSMGRPMCLHGTWAHHRKSNSFQLISQLFCLEENIFFWFCDYQSHVLGLCFFSLLGSFSLDILDT